MTAGPGGGSRSPLLGAFLGPLGVPGWGRWMAIGITLLLTLVTQVGGCAVWPFWDVIRRSTHGMTLWKRTGVRFLLYFLAYLIPCQTLLPIIAAQTGRVRLPLVASESTPLGPGWWGFVLLNRTYVRPHTREAIVKAAVRTERQHPGTVIRYLDAGFPFPFPPLLPHLSHADGQRVDVAFLFKRNGKPVDQALSPIGYWGYARESQGRVCNAPKTWGPISIHLRWDFDAMQALWPDLSLDTERNRTFFRHAASDPRVCSILLEPTLHKSLAAPKLRANGCGVARHDDHSHLTIRSSCR